MVQHCNRLLSGELNIFIDISESRQQGSEEFFFEDSYDCWQVKSTRLAVAGILSS